MENVHTNLSLFNTPAFIYAPIKLKVGNCYFPVSDVEQQFAVLLHRVREAGVDVVCTPKWVSEKLTRINLLHQY